LLVDAGYHGAGIRIESIKRIVVTNRRNGATHQVLEIDVSLGRDFTRDHYQAGRGQGFAGYAAGGSSVRQASRMASETWSAILSG